MSNPLEDTSVLQVFIHNKNGIDANHFYPMSPSIHSKTLVILQTTINMCLLPYSLHLLSLLLRPSPRCELLATVSPPFPKGCTTHKPPLRPSHTNAPLLRSLTHNHLDHPLTPTIGRRLSSSSCPFITSLGHQPSTSTFLSGT